MTTSMDIINKLQLDEDPDTRRMIFFQVVHPSLHHNRQHDALVDDHLQYVEQEESRSENAQEPGTIFGGDGIRRFGEVGTLSSWDRSILSV